MALDIFTNKQCLCLLLTLFANTVMLGRVMKNRAGNLIWSTPAAAGLYHFTTRTDQSRDASQTAVNIGFHYVSTTGVSSSNLRDSDHDGIPDYIENWHGDGNYSAHIDSETDWQNAYTLSGVYDPTNSVYDYIDLSGDGLVGEVKRMFGLGPFDTTNPLRLAGAGASLKAGSQLDYPLAIAPSAQALLLRVTVDGVPQPGSSVFANEDGTWSVGWDTTDTANGDHLVQVELMYTQGEMYGASVRRLAFGSPTLVRVSNPITFFPVNDAFTDELFIRGTAVPDVSSFNIRIYTDDAAHLPLKTMTGYPAGGEITESWDFTADNVPVTGNIVCEIDFTGSIPFPSLLKHYTWERYQSGNGFVLAWGWDPATSDGSPQDFARRALDVRTALVDMLAYDGDNQAFSLLPTGSLADGTLGNNFEVSAFRFDGGVVSHDALLAAVADVYSRHFFFWGHGCPDFITPLRGSRIQAFPQTLTSREIALACGNPDMGDRAGRLYPTHRVWRFVFMDACGAYSEQMARAFGIPFTLGRSRSSVADYAQYHRSPGAFIGWDRTVAGPDITCADADSERVAAQQLVLLAWKSGFSAEQAMALWDNYIWNKPFGCNANETYGDVRKRTGDKDSTEPGKRIEVWTPAGTWSLSGARDVTRFGP